MSNELKVVSGGNSNTPITVIGDQFFIRLAREIQAVTSNDQLAACMDRMASWTDSLDKLQTFVRTKVKEIVERYGEVTTEKGSKVLQTDNYEIPMRPTRTGTDPKKLERLLRNKGVDVSAAMDASITYKVNTDKIKTCLQNRMLTDEEIETCEYDKSYTLLPVKRINKNESF
jgi:hypothetical protein